MSRTPWASSFFGIGSMPHSGMPGPPSGPASWRTSTESAVTGERRIVDPRFEVVVVAEDDRGSGVLEQPALRRGVLDHRAIGGEVAAQHGDAAFRPDRPIARRDDVVVADVAPSTLSPSVCPLTVGHSMWRQVAQPVERGRAGRPRSRSPPSGTVPTAGCWR